MQKMIQIAILLMAGFVQAGTTNSVAPEIEVTICFIKFRQPSCGNAMPADQMIREYLTGQNVTHPAVTNFSEFLPEMINEASLSTVSLCIRTQSGTEGVYKMTKAHQYPLEIHVRNVAVTNREKVAYTTVPVPAGYESLESGIVASATPVYDAESGIIDIDLALNVTDEPIWEKREVRLENPGGRPLDMVLELPIVRVSSIRQSVSLPNNNMLICGKLETTETVTTIDKVPVLGSIPWLGRLFRSTNVHKVDAVLVPVVAVKLIESKTGLHPETDQPAGRR